MARFAAAVREGFSRAQKEISPEFFYDEIGSALFEAITYLPEYGLTNADARILAAHAGEVVSVLGGAPAVAELGSGSGRKTRAVLEAVNPRALRDYFPIEISTTALEDCRSALAPVANVWPVSASFLHGLDQVRDEIAERRRLLVLFLGSSIGNFAPLEARAFLAGVRSRLHKGDALLLGTDLTRDRARLLLAYDDPCGVTAAFNRNLLGRMNRDLGADFDLTAFQHQVRYAEDPPRIEMHLRARRATSVRIPIADMTCRFRAGETILTERSHKYTREDVSRLAGEAGFSVLRGWIDEEWPFAETLLTTA